MFFEPKRRNRRVKPSRIPEEVADTLGAIGLAVMGYILTVLVFSL